MRKLACALSRDSLLPRNRQAQRFARRAESSPARKGGELHGSCPKARHTNCAAASISSNRPSAWLFLPASEARSVRCKVYCPTHLKFHHKLPINDKQEI